jgi:hypothetical protein
VKLPAAKTGLVSAVNAAPVKSVRTRIQTMRFQFGEATVTAPPRYNRQSIQNYNSNRHKPIANRLQKEWSAKDKENPDEAVRDFMCARGRRVTG